MTAKEYLKQAYLLDKQIQVEVKERLVPIRIEIWKRRL